jgi:arylsulfatase A-like enzyme
MAMSGSDSQVDDAGATDSLQSALASGKTRVVSVLALSAWCGLVAGLLEVGTLILRKHWFDPNRLYAMSRQFVWLIPVTNLAVFLALGAIGCLVMHACPSRGRWFFVRALCALTFLPTFLTAFPRVYGLAWLVVTLGVASRVAPLLERGSASFRRFVGLSFPILACAVVTLAASCWLGDWIKQARGRSRPMPPAGSPNVLLVVMDTVAAGHLDLHGYARPTGTTLAELAKRGVRFDSARATSSWTLPSHASMFTGRWFHELSVGWLTPLDQTYPTLAEFLSDRGYATAGFVANYAYCARDSGLARGFTYYRDFIFPELTCFKMAALVDRGLDGLQAIEDVLEDKLEFSRFRPYLKYLWRLLDTDRKGAAVVNQELVDWLSERASPDRPFFAFLNYYDAHYPYQLASGRMHRFGAVASDNSQRDLLQEWGELDKTTLSRPLIEFAASAYDECIADLDEQIGILYDELKRRGVLQRTWLIIVSDHGESFGEHAGIFCHGTSLYQTELHVPLLIVPPDGIAGRKVVGETVSLRDLAATVVDVAGMQADSPFPGESLARFWNQPAEPVTAGAARSVHGLAELVPSDPAARNPSGLPKLGLPLGGLADGEWSYIRRDGDAHEELFHLREDATEQHNLAGDPAARSQLAQMRGRLRQSTAGPLLPGRFNP